MSTARGKRKEKVVGRNGRVAIYLVMYWKGCNGNVFGSFEIISWKSVAKADGI